METSFLLGRENVKKKLAVSSYFIFRSSLWRALTWLRRCKFLESLNVHKKKIFSTVRSVFTEVCCVIKHPKIYKTGKFLAIKITEIFLMFFFPRNSREPNFFLSLKIVTRATQSRDLADGRLKSLWARVFNLKKLMILIQTSYRFIPRSLCGRRLKGNGKGEVTHAIAREHTVYFPIWEVGRDNFCAWHARKIAYMLAHSHEIVY